MIPRVLTAALLWFSVSARAADPVALLPDNTLFGAAVTRPEKLAALAEHPVVKAVKPGRIKDAFEELIGALAEGGHAKIWKEECDLTPGEVLTKFSGTMAVGIFDVKERKQLKEGEQEVEMAGAAVFSGDEKLVTSIFRAMGKIEAQSKEDSEAAPDEGDDDPFAEESEDGDEMKKEKDGTDLADILTAKERTVQSGKYTLHILEPEKTESRGVEALAWCLRDDILLIASGEKPLQAMLDRAESGREEGSFAATRAWKTAKESTGDAEFLAVMNGAVVMELLESSDESKTAAVEALLKVLGFDKLETMAFGLRSDGAGIGFHIHFGLGAAPWYLDLLKPVAGAQPPRFIPADVGGAAWMPVDLGNLGSVLLEKLPGFFPPAERIIKTLLSGYKRAADVDLEKEFIQQLGTGYFQITKAYDTITFDDIASAPEVNQAVNIVCPDKEGAVIGFRLKDPKIVDTALRSVITKMFKSSMTLDGREYLGWKIHSSKAPPEVPKGREDDEEEDSEEMEEDSEEMEEDKPVPYSLVIAEDWLLVGVGRQELLESVLAAVKNPPAVPAWEVPGRQAVLKTMADGGYYTHFEDLKLAAPVLVISLLDMASVIPGVEIPEALSDPVKLMEGAEFPLHSFERYTLTPRGFSLETRLVVSPGK